MAQIRIEQKRTGPIWIAAIVVAIIVIVALWLYARHRSAATPSAPAAPASPAAYRVPSGGGAASLPAA